MVNIYNIQGLIPYEKYIRTALVLMYETQWGVCWPDYFMRCDKFVHNFYNLFLYINVQWNDDNFEIKINLT